MCFISLFYHANEDAFISHIDGNGSISKFFIPNSSQLKLVDTVVVFKNIIRSTSGKEASWLNEPGIVV